MSNPYITTVITCAAPNCGKQKADVNHWWICHITDGDPPRFSLKPWDDAAIREEDNILPLCGSACASKMLSMYLSKAQGGQT